MIDRSLAAINATDYKWFIDADPTPCGPDVLGTTGAVFNSLGITNYFFDDTENPITLYPDSIMTYTSNGIWTTVGPPPPPPIECSPWTYFLEDYIQNQLTLKYVAGAFFNTMESHNGLSIGTYPVIRTRDQGLIADFTLMGGTVAIGQAFHFPHWYVSNEEIFPLYALGYTFIESVYQSLGIINGTNVIVGDPLTRVTYPCEPTIISSNTTLTSGDYNCDIIVQKDAILTIESTNNLPVNFNRNAALIVKGGLIISYGTELNFNAYSELRLEENSYLAVNPNSAVSFRDHTSFTINDNYLFFDNSTLTFEDDSNILINGTAELSENSTFNLVDGMSCKVNGLFKLNSGSTLNLQDNSSLTSNGKLTFNNASTLNVNNTSKFFSYEELILNEGVIINLQNSSSGEFELGGVVKSMGNINDSVIVNCSSSSNTLRCFDIDTLLMQYTNINNGSISFSIADGIVKPRLIQINNSAVYNSPQINYFLVVNTEGVDITLTDNYFSTGYPNNAGCLYFLGFNNVDIIRNNIHYTTYPWESIGITALNNKSLNINHSYMDGFNTGIQRGYIFQDDLEEVELIYNEDIRIYNCTLNGGQSNNGTAISIGMVEDYQVSGVKIDLNEISDYKTGIQINNADNFSLGISNNSITDYELIGISVLNGNEALIKENLINANESEAEDCMGIYLSQVNNPSILGNTIDAYNVSNPGNGIVLISGDGEIRLNTVQNHFYGIELGSASPKIGTNTITNNKAYGIYISDNSNPDLTGSFVGDDQFPLSGYNTIRENGLCEETQNSELYLLSSLVKLEKGCNTIADDRDGVQQQCNNLYLVDGRKIPESIIQARGNYWGNHPVYGNDPTGRFGEEVTIDYSDYFSEPCTYSQGEAELILASSKGEVYDTLFSTGNTATGLSDIESKYAAANNYFYNNQYNQAKPEYEGIIQNYGNDKGSIQAYNRIYTIAKLTNSSPSVFNQLKDFYIQQAANQTDSLIIGTLAHLGDLCLVSAGEYLPAINNFDEIAQQNPNTDIALYRQIDALTTSLLMPQDSSLNKGVLGKYSVTNLSDYTNKLNELLKTRGKSGLEIGEEILPTEFTLYQNFPNPFNPVTTIKYDLPNTSEVTLIIYDILGRKVKELVNTKQQAGRYEIQFNASTLSSGVYIYQLSAEKYMQSRKMILLK